MQQQKPIPASRLVRGPLPAPEECEGCPLAVEGKPHRPVTGIGPSTPKFILLGEGPGRSEVQQNLPFIGKSGQLVTKGLKALGVDRSEVWIGNTTLCLPNHAGNKEADVTEAAKHCRQRLLEELKDLPAVPVLLMGKHATRAFLGDDFKITELSGTYHKIDVEDFGEMEIIPTLHPAAILRGGNGDVAEGSKKADAHANDLLYWAFLYDLGKVARLAKGDPHVRFSYDIQIETYDMRRGQALIEGICREAYAAGEITIDTETRNVSPAECKTCLTCEGHDAREAYHARLTAIGLSTEDRAVAVWFEALNLPARQAIKRLLADPCVRKKFHNRGYDEIVLPRNGFEVRGPITCTMFLHHNAFPGLTHKLQRVVSQFFAVHHWKSEYRHGRGTRRELLTYCATDTLGTARVAPKLEVCVKRSGGERTYAMDMRKCEIAAKMQMRGIPIDLDVNRAIHRHFKPILKDAQEQLLSNLDGDESRTRFLEHLAVEKAKFKRKNDDEDFMARYETRLEEAREKWEELNLNSHDEVVAFLKSCGVVLNQLTKKGRISTKKDVLEAIRHPVVRTLLQFREYDKLNGTFIEPIPYLVDKALRAHISWVPNKITGRWGSSPNFQNWSKGSVKEDEIRVFLGLGKKEKVRFEHWLTYAEIHGALAAGVPNLRWQVVAGKGRVLVGADYAQLEARIIALLSGDEYLCKAFMEGLDIHSEFAADILGDRFRKLEPKSPEWKYLRDIIKRAEYGYLYGATPITVWKVFVAEGIDVDLKTITAAFRTFRKKMPRVALWHASLFREAMKTGETRSFLYGRRRAFPLGDMSETVLKNFKVQASASDIADTGIDRLDQALDAERDWIILQGHDAITVETDEDRADTVSKLMTEALTQEYTINGVTMKFAVECDIDRSWAGT